MSVWHCSHVARLLRILGSEKEEETKTLKMRCALHREFCSLLYTGVINSGRGDGWLCDVNKCIYYINSGTVHFLLFLFPPTNAHKCLLQ